MTQQDFVVFEPNHSKGILKINDDQINTGFVKSFGSGYYTDFGNFITQIGIKVGDKITFVNHLQIDIEGVKTYITRGRDIILVENESKT